MLQTPAPPLPVAQRRSWPQRLLLGAGIVLSVLLFGMAGALAAGWNKVNSFERVAVFLDRPTKSQPVNFLFVGSDSRESVAAEDADADAFLEGESSGRRSDTIMVVRADQKARRLSVLSIPRDLFVPIAGTGEDDRINSAYGLGEQVLVDTVSDYLHLPINHYVEVDFGGFRALVDTLGGVPIYFDSPMRDEWTGLDVQEAGCHVLDGGQALAFARSRHLEVVVDGEWQTDPTSDLGRISRQQVFLRRSMDRAAALGLSDAGKLSKLLDVATQHVSFDQGLSITDVASLIRKFASFAGDDMQTFSLPTTPFTTEDGAQVLQLNVDEAQPTLDIFRGLGAATVAPVGGKAVQPAATPQEVTVSVLNGSGVPGQASLAAAGLRSWGFVVAKVGDADRTGQARTTLRYGPGAKASADLVAAALQVKPTLTEDPAVEGGVVLVTGGDFGGTVEAPAVTTAQPATSAPLIGVTPPAAPPGESCR